MDDRLITIAIYTYQKAQIIKGILESEGIDVFIQNVNLIQPVVSSGVRVRINEKVLPHALNVLEQYPDLTKETTVDKEQTPTTKRILVPIDFSTHSQAACKIAFDFAHSIDAVVQLLHVYFNPYFPGAIPVSDITYELTDTQVGIEVRERATQELNKFVGELQQQVANGTLPPVPFTYTLREGIPEDEVSLYCREVKPSMIVMGTRGSHQKEIDLIGSVTAEVIDSARCPVFATPLDATFVAGGENNKVAFFTQFDQHDLLALDTLMRLLGKHPFQIDFIHVAPKHSAWDEVKLAGIKSYFETHYPTRKAVYSMVDGEDFLPAIERYITDNAISALAIPARRRNLFARLFNPSIATKMLFHSNTPLLVIPQPKS